MAKRKNISATAEDAEVTLEMAMTELSQIVSRLESGQETLDESLAQFERGMSLLRVCHRQLDAAAQRIELVTQFSPQGEPVIEEFDATSTMQRSSQAESSSRRKPHAAEAGDDSELLF